MDIPSGGQYQVIAVIKSWTVPSRYGYKMMDSIKSLPLWNDGQYQIFAIIKWWTVPSQCRYQMMDSTKS